MLITCDAIMPVIFIADYILACLLILMTAIDLCVMPGAGGFLKIYYVPVK
jgi:hypothetical protein